MKFHNNKREKAKGFNDSSKFENSVPIPTYVPNQSLQPKEYLLSPSFVNFEGDFEKRCIKFLNKAKVDQFNGSYMDAMIQKMVKEALAHLSVQRGEHIDLITNLLRRMHVGSKIKCQSKLEQALREQKELDCEMKKIKKIYYHKTSFGEEKQVVGNA